MEYLIQYKDKSLKCLDISCGAFKGEQLAFKAVELKYYMCVIRNNLCKLDTC